MVNNISNYYYVKIFLHQYNNFTRYNFTSDGPKWAIHIVDYKENDWLPETYEIQDKYTYSTYGSITILIIKESYQPYSSVKSARI